MTAPARLTGWQYVGASHTQRRSIEIAIGSFVSRLTGFVRAVTLVAVLGATTETSIAYNAANTLPNMIYELALGGVLSSVLVPVLVRARQSADEGAYFTQRLLASVTLGLGVVSVAAALCSPVLVAPLVPRTERPLTALFAALMLPQIVFYGLTALIGAVLNVRGCFATAAWAPALNNVVVCALLIAYLWVPGPHRPTPATISGAQAVALGVGATAGVAAQAAVLVVRLRRSGFRWRWRRRNSADSRVSGPGWGSTARWAVVYVLISQIGVVAIQRVGSYNGSLTIFTYADLVLQLPFGILVLSHLTAVMPSLSRVAQSGGDVRTSYWRMVRFAIVSMVPVAVSFVLFAERLGAVVFGSSLFGHGAGTSAGGAMIGKAVASAAFGIVPFAFVMIQMRIFYAMEDARTPCVINIVMVAVKVVLVEVPSDTLSAVWLNVATSVSYLAGACAGHALLTRQTRTSPNSPGHRA